MAATSPIAPTITSQPASQVVSSGEQASFRVVAEGSDPLVYQWRRNGTLIDGAAAPTYTTPATESDDGAAFSVRRQQPGRGGRERDRQADGASRSR